MEIFNEYFFRYLTPNFTRQKPRMEVLQILFAVFMYRYFYVFMRIFFTSVLSFIYNTSIFTFFIIQVFLRFFHNTGIFTFSMMQVFLYF